MFATKLQRLAYKYIAKPFFFSRDPEWTHDFVCRVGKVMGYCPCTRRIAKFAFAYKHNSLEQRIKGIHFPNPIGLTEGFDKNALLTQILPEVGFGYEIIGSVTADPCGGNQKPRLWRLPKSRGLVVYYGLMNDGAKAIAERLNNKTFRFPLGVSIAKTNCKRTADTQAGIDDYVKGYTTMSDIGDFDVINISCPNAYGGEPFSNPKSLEALLLQIDKVRNSKPLFIKMAVDITTQEFDELVAVMDRHRIDGMILSNLTKKYDRAEIHQAEIKEGMKGGISGKPTENVSNVLISHAYKTVGDRYVIVGVGGVFNAEDAYEKIRQGASLVQLATGMIYEGPQLIGEINKGLVKLLKRDGFKNIHEAIGSAHRK